MYRVCSSAQTRRAAAKLTRCFFGLWIRLKFSFDCKVNGYSNIQILYGIEKQSDIQVVCECEYLPKYFINSSFLPSDLFHIYIIARYLNNAIVYSCVGIITSRAFIIFRVNLERQQFWKLLICYLLFNNWKHSSTTFE